MLPVCSATTSCSSHSQSSLHGGLQPLSSYWKAFEVRCCAEDKAVLGVSNGNHLHGVSFKTNAASPFYSKIIDGREQSGASSFTNPTCYQNEFGDSKVELFNNWNYYTVSSEVTSGEQESMDFAGQLTENTSILPEPADPEVLPIDVIPDEPASLSDSLSMNGDSLSSMKTNIEESFSGFNESFGASVNKGEAALKDSVDKITSSVESTVKEANEAVDNAINIVSSSIDQLRVLVANKFTGFSNDIKDVSNQVVIGAVDVLRHAIIQVGDYLNEGATFVIYSYGSAKNSLPLEVQNVLNLSEEKVSQVLGPAGTALQQVYIALEGLEESLGLGPNDPIVPFVLLIGTSATLWVSYWLFTYGGYAGDLSPKSTLELLVGKENAVLIDIRPEDLRERDGIPDLRRAARFRYGSVTLPEVDGSVRKLLKSGKDFDDMLTAAIIRNLKIVKDRSKVIVMDVDGTCSKGIARSLRKLGVKQSYLVQGGFRSWAQEGLRVKELKPETTLTILNEEAEAILEEINPTPVKVLGYGVGLIAALYALLEWEKTLQFIGVIGLGQTIYWRVASYGSVQDLRQDVRLLLTPVRLGGQAIWWAAGKLESNGVGLPTSPSSSEVQNRVLQAAAKHESQPSDGEENQELVAPVNQKVDLSEA